MIEVYITKYALTQGVFKKIAEKVDGNPNMIQGDRYEYYHGKDWHEIRESAVKQTDLIIRKKITSLEKQLEKLRKLNAEEMVGE